ncbi:hypothetical protein [Vibrio phage vB_VmeM-Yong XC32]|nr:hypothetical protein [Vibrio phage vB_VmeM-Yong XC31]QAX96457.1 hypothetical protein [Vibrio phage vB_VmeM-Yong XC32]QAX96774.1 hypothetical protein [Vibrio phage vB_VmeM-Yong MS31]QAX97093.1 hypothetical protein [Vibrio phage vB_VmeM-Yong MS32]
MLKLVKKRLAGLQRKISLWEMKSYYEHGRIDFPSLEALEAISKQHKWFRDIEINLLALRENEQVFFFDKLGHLVREAEHVSNRTVEQGPYQPEGTVATARSVGPWGTDEEGTNAEVLTERLLRAIVKLSKTLEETGPHNSRVNGCYYRIAHDTLMWLRCISQP